MCRSHFVIVLLLFCIGCSERASDSSSKNTRTSGDRIKESNQEAKVVKYPSPETWQYANEEQRERALRSFEQLKKRNVPVYGGPLFVDGEEEATTQGSQEVARRALVLWVVDLRAEGMPQSDALNLVEKLDLWASVSPDERRFLEDANPTPEKCQQLVWRLESIWVLLWALGYVDELNWPDGMCDVPTLVKVMKAQETNPEFVTSAKLRDKAQLLDAQDLIMRIHWAIRDAFLHQDGFLPDDLNWSNGDNMVPVASCEAVGVVEERHYTLNWLLNFMDPQDWDHVDTPT